MDVRVRFWSADARTGEILGEIHHLTGTLISDLSGAQCSVRVGLDHLVRDGLVMDVQAVEFVLGLLEPGARTIVATDEARRCLGEWLVRSRVGTSPEGGVQVGLVEWKVLPKMRALPTPVTYAAADQYVIARDILHSVYNVGQGGTILGMPAGNSGVLRSLSLEAWSCYYGDILDDIGEPFDGFEWVVDTTLTWVRDRPAHAARRANFGHPVLYRGARTVVFDQDSPGSRRGRAISITGGVDWSLYATTITSRGGGEGGRSPLQTHTDPAGPTGGRLRTEKLLSYPSVLDPGTLSSLTQNELARASSAAATYRATGYADRLNDWPVPGIVAWLYTNATWVYPRGIDLFARVGRVSWSVDDAGQVDQVTVDAVDGSDWDNPTGGGG